MSFDYAPDSKLSHARKGAALGSAMICLLTASSGLAEPSTLPPEVGYHYQEVELPRTMAVNGALRAYSNSVNALFINPANMAASRIYHATAFAQLWPEANRTTLGAAAVDSIVSSSGMAGGVGAVYTLQDPDGLDREATDLRFALAFPVSPEFLVGLGGRYLWLSQNGLGPLGPSLASGGSRDERIVDGLGVDVGATVRVSELLSLSLVGANINNPGNGFQPTSIGGGVGVGSKIFTVEVDILDDFTTYEDATLRAMGGAELSLAEHFALRGGYRYDGGAESHSASAGFGYIDKTMEAEIGARRVLIGDVVTSVGLSFTFHIESTGLTPSPGDTF